MIIIAHDIRSMHNVGAILRSAAAFDTEQVYLTGITATPPRKEIAKVALGAEDLVEWSAGEIREVIKNLKDRRVQVLGLETGDDARPIQEVAAEAKAENKTVALVLGHEVEGIDQKTRELLDGLVVIPMGAKRSLNVSVAAGIAMFALS